MITRKMTPHGEPAFLQLREIIQGATAAFLNLEVLFHDYEDDVIPAPYPSGSVKNYVRAAPELAHDLAWLGFDMVSLGNNHTMDFGAGGARRTAAAAEAAGLAVAGFGENLARARQATYVETPGGRIALISIASTFAEQYRAGHQRPDMRGRPGLSPIRYETHVTLSSEGMTGLRAALEEYRPDLGSRSTVTFGGVQFTEGSTASVKTVPHAGDLAEIVAVVEDAKRQADWVLVTSHTHEGAHDLNESRSNERTVPADFIVEVARGVVDAGADIFIGHGPHRLRGIEVYRGKPIFYSLGNFIFQNETVELQPYDMYEALDLPHEAQPGQFQDVRVERAGSRSFQAGKIYWESVVPVVEFQGGELSEVRLYPIMLGQYSPRPVRGRPLLADDALGQEVLEGLAELSTPYGTSLQIEGGVGVIRR